MQNNSSNLFYTEPENTNEVHIHVKGDRMPNSLFLRILDMMKQFYDKKSIVFIVYNADMKQLVKDSVPSSLYVRVDLCKEEGLRRAG